VLSAYDELYAYTMGRPGFILQHVVDAQGAQSAAADGPPIRLVFSLVGLYLRVEKRFSGHAVQKVHMHLGREKRAWPRLTLPPTPGTLTPTDVLAASEGAERDSAIDTWCASVWAAFEENRPAVVALLRAHGFS
jgi:hypothetical protein